MIKWILGILVLANITLWMWGTWYRAESGDQIKVDINGDSIRLLSAPDVQKDRRQPGAAAKTKKLKEVNIGGRCFRIGPFTSLKNVKRAEKMLSKNSVRVRRYRKKARIMTYRVYLPRQRSKSAALHLQSRLHSKGFRDTFILNKRGMVNAISVGVFVNQRNARTRIRKLRKVGFRAKQEVYAAVRKASWLDLSSNRHTLGGLKKIKWGAVTVGVHQMSACK